MIDSKIDDDINQASVAMNEIEDVAHLCVDAQENSEQLVQIETKLLDTDNPPSEFALKMADIAIESIITRLGIKDESKVISTENHEMALESLVSKIKHAATQIWEALIKAFKWILEKIKHVFMMITRNRDALLKHMNNLLDESENIRGVKDGAVLSGAAKHHFVIDKKANYETMEIILKDTAKLFIIAEKGSDVVKEHTKKLEVYQEEFFTFNFGNQQPKDNPLFNIGNDVFKMLDFLGEVSKGRNNKPDEGTYDIYYGSFIDGKSLHLSNPLFIRINFTKPYQITSPDNADILNQKEIQQSLNAGIKLIERLKEYDKIIDVMKTTSKECSTYCLKRFKEEQGKILAKKVNDPKSAKFISSMIYSLNSIISQISVALPLNVFKTSKYVSDYAQSSLRCYETVDKSKGLNTINPPLQLTN